MSRGQTPEWARWREGGAYTLGAEEACAPHAEALGCRAELATVGRVAEHSGADLQLARAGAGGPSGAMEAVADVFTSDRGLTTAARNASPHSLQGAKAPA